MRSKIKKISSLFLVITLTVCMLNVVPFTANAVVEEKNILSEADEDDFEYTLLRNPGEDTIVIIYGYNGNAENLVIPQTIEGYTVVTIGSDAFSGCTSLKKVTIPDSVK